MKKEDSLLFRSYVFYGEFLFNYSKLNFSLSQTEISIIKKSSTMVEYDSQYKFSVEIIVGKNGTIYYNKNNIDRHYPQKLYYSVTSLNYYYFDTTYLKT